MNILFECKVKGSLICDGINLLYEALELFLDDIRFYKSRRRNKWNE